ncbi:MAG TPA: sodium:solute symporter family protein [archaeon]|nr:sodium:solute symporter family protein [archaeon]
MKFNLLDWTIFIGYFVVVLLICFYFVRRAGRSMQTFFLSGRNLPWYIAGTSMIATTFAADTPLAVTELVGKNGLAGNWFWWNFILGTTLTVFFFSRLWRRSGILTDIEFIELRYCGKPAAFLRGFRSIYLGLFVNCVIMAWVNLAMFKILRITMGWDNMLIVVIGCMAVVTLYSAASGIWGAAVADLLHFCTAMTGCIVLAVVAVKLPQIGGIAGLKASLPAETFRFLPSVGASSPAEVGVGGMLKLTLPALIAFLGLQWWASWYPGAEPGGGGYIVQRMMSAKDERHSLFATLWFNIGHYCVRPWPWIIVALVSLVLYPDLPLAQKGDGFVLIIRDHLPAGLRGLLIAAFFAAYMSTIATQLNLGTSYLINDGYRRFIKKDGDDRHYVLASRVTTVIMMAVALYITTIFETISGAWQFLIECGAGVGLVLLLRWFWWRVNAWSEIAGLVAPFLAYGYIYLYTDIPFPITLFPIITFTTIVWITVTLLTSPVSAEHLKAFYRRVHPGGKGWKHIAAECPEVKRDSGYLGMLWCWLASAAMIYGALFGLGKLILGEFVPAILFSALALVMAWVIYQIMRKVGFEKVID